MIPDPLQETDQFLRHQDFIRSVSSSKFLHFEIRPFSTQYEIFVSILCNRIISNACSRFNGIFGCRERDALDSPVPVV